VEFVSRRRWRLWVISFIVVFLGAAGMLLAATFASSPLECVAPVQTYNSLPENNLGAIVELKSDFRTRAQVKWLVYRYGLTRVDLIGRGAFVVEPMDVSKIGRLGCSKLVRAMEYLVPASLN
jgi:hypothetical protein